MNQLNSGTLDKSSTDHAGGTRLINPKFTFDSLPIQMLQNYWWLTKSLVSTGYHNWLLCHKHRLIIWRLPRCCTALYRVFAFRCSGHANFEGYGGAWTRCQPWLSDAACEEQWSNQSGALRETLVTPLHSCVILKQLFGFRGRCSDLSSWFSWKKETEGTQALASHSEEDTRLNAIISSN